MGGNVKAAQMEAIKAALLKSLGMLREMNTSLGERMWCTGLWASNAWSSYDAGCLRGPVVQQSS